MAVQSNPPRRLHARRTLADTDPVTTRLFLTGLVIAVILRFALSGTDADIAALILFWACAIPLLAGLFRRERSQDPPSARLTDSRVRYGLLAVGILSLFSGLLTDGPTTAASVMSVIGLLGYTSLTLAAAISRRRRRRIAP
jgi:hypothetical protein